MQYRFLRAWVIHSMQFFMDGSWLERPMPKPVIIYPPITAAEYLERRKILREALKEGNTHFVIVDKKPDTK